MFTDPRGLLRELNQHSREHFKDRGIYFTKGDLESPKLAYWMATGSGKTILMHINYLQFLHYHNKHHVFDFDNVLLITPSESLSAQHLEEMKEDSIPAERFTRNNTGYFTASTELPRVQVIEISKLTEEAETQEGVSVNVERFGGKNLIFVDEGHKGTASGRKWVDLRRKLASEGFTFEYSATFGQAVASSTRASERNALLEEYGKAIVFNYSYRFFHDDGYGKEFRIVNLKKNLYQEFNETLMMANLLSFYEQKRLYEELNHEIQEFNIEEPLWIFVGSKVKGSQNRSDIYDILRFLNRVLREDARAVEIMGNILSGHSGLMDNDNRDLFSPEYPERKLSFLREKELSPEEIYQDALRRLFHINAPAPLRLVNLKKAPGEIALFAGASDTPFGVINIGDDSQFLKLVKEESEHIPIDDDEMTPSLFDDIKKPHSPINILIGARKFLEGWDCWRVSNMGLLNIGKKEGTQVIQLFGRGVRLKGRGFSLKRSRPDDEKRPGHLPVLETLNIFGIRANYMDEFRKILEEEGVTDTVDVDFEIKVNEAHLEQGLFIPHVDVERFPEEQMIQLKADESIRLPRVDLRPMTDILTSLDEEGIRATLDVEERRIEREYLELIDWDRIYFSILEHKHLKGWDNLVVSKETLREVIEKGLYRLSCPTRPRDLIRPGKFEHIPDLEEVVISILKSYIRSFYHHRKNKWTLENLEVVKLSSSHPNLSFKKYLLKIPEDQPLIIETTKKDADKTDTMWASICEGASGTYLTNIYFDRHLYQPLFAESNDMEITPAGLNEGEQDFINNLKAHFENNPEFYRGRDLYVLRNLPRRGIGFFGSQDYFYPDFILWIDEPEVQRLIFADPHGLIYAAGIEDEKLLLNETVKELEKRMAEAYLEKRLEIESYIISVTPYEDVRIRFGNLSKKQLEERNILFKEDRENYIVKMMSK